MLPSPERGKSCNFHPKPVKYRTTHYTAWGSPLSPTPPVSTPTWCKHASPQQRFPLLLSTTTRLGDWELRRGKHVATPSRPNTSSWSRGTSTGVIFQPEVLQRPEWRRMGRRDFRALCIASRSGIDIIHVLPSSADLCLRTATTAWKVVEGTVNTQLTMAVIRKRGGPVG